MPESSEPHFVRPCPGEAPSEPEFLHRQRKTVIGEAAWRRIHMTCSCRDCDALPKVEGAGEVFIHEGLQVQRMHNGVMVLADGYCGPWMTELIRRLKGHHEPQEERAFAAVMESLENPRLMIELGSYWSYYSLWFLQRHPAARVVMVEPDPNHLAIGMANFHLNRRDGQFLQAAVGRSPRDAALFKCESLSEPCVIPTVSVDSLADALHLDDCIDVLLADIQGAEDEALEGMAQAARRKLLRYVFLSTHARQISGDPRTHQKCLDRIRAMGGHIVAEHTVGQSFSGDGLIVASFDPMSRVHVSISRNRPENSLFGEE